MLNDDEREAYSAQYKALGLRPWQEPPCVMGPRPVRGTEHEARMMRLLAEMRKAGVSRWAHDPLAALAAAQPRRKREAV